VVDRRQRGISGEDAAAEYLQSKGYRILERNYRFRRGEIDIVAQDGATLVFVEVKARHSREFGTPEEAVTFRKRNQLRKIARGYLFDRKIDGRECRFDVIGIEYENGTPLLRHLKDAF
jgi:putative endonuclease